MECGTVGWQEYCPVKPYLCGSGITVSIHVSFSTKHWASFFFLEIFFLCGPFLKSLLNLLQYCFCFMFCFFGREADGILAPRPGIEPAPLALEGEVLTAGPPGKSHIGLLEVKTT